MHLIIIKEVVKTDQSRFCCETDYVLLHQGVVSMKKLDDRSVVDLFCLSSVFLSLLFSSMIHHITVQVTNVHSAKQIFPTPLNSIQLVSYL